MWPVHASGHWMNGVGDLDAPGSCEGSGQLDDRVLGLGHGQAVTRYDQHPPRVGEQRPDVGGVSRTDRRSGPTPDDFGRPGTRQAAEDDVGERAPCGVAHHLGQEGTLVGTSGALLTKMMSDAMGRSIPNIILGGLPSAGSTEMVGGGAGPSVRSADATDIGTLLAYSRRVLIVPGYGLAVAQAQHTVVELARSLEARGVEVAYAIHPVAGRMPGHMNVLLAEADVPYESLDDLDAANAKFTSTDVALVVGANDVVNPAARDDSSSPLFGMPILNADQATHVVFMKRSMRPGFSGVDNALLYDPRTVLLFGDAKDSLTKLVAAVRVA